jgi:hypothetical protein
MQRLKAYFPKNVAEITLDSLTQWDKDVLLHISGEELPETFEIHIGYEGITETYRFPLQKTDGVATVKIPNVLFEQTRSIKAWIYVIDPEGCRTTKTITIPLVKREKPVDYASGIEPSQKDAVEQLIEKSNELISTSEDLQKQTEALQEQNAAILEGLETLDALLDSTLEKQNTYIGGAS